MKVLIVTGMSGSGKSKALNVLEDNGYYCLDNLPLKLVPQILEMISGLEDFPNKICITVDVRNSDVSREAVKVIAGLKRKVSVKVLFLDCEQSILLKRYKESRRLHPLMMFDDKLDLVSAIEKERHILEEIRQRADMVIDTSLLSTGDLKEKLLEMLPSGESPVIQINFVAFGYKYGIPSDCDLVFDVRCLPNPFYIDELKTKTGLDKEVRDYVMSCSDSQELFSKITGYLDLTIPLYRHEGKAQLVVGLGCTGGQHRSLTFAILLAEKYAAEGLSTRAWARDSSKNSVMISGSVNT